MNYDLILQNNATKQKFLFKGLTASTENELFIGFDDFEMPDDVPYGEYLYYLIPYTDDLQIEYQEKDVVENMIATIDGIDYQLKNINHSSGLLKYHNSESPVIERDTNKQVVYRRKKG